MNDSDDTFRQIGMHTEREGDRVQKSCHNMIFNRSISGQWRGSNMTVCLSGFCDGIFDRFSLKVLSPRHSKIKKRKKCLC